MAPPVCKMPEGYAIGMRVVTNARYAKCYVRSPKARYGTIIGGSRGMDGPILVKLDDQKHAKPLPVALVDIIVDRA
jgi:hypothetical protein